MQDLITQFDDELNPLKRLRDQSYALELKGCPSLKVFISRFHEAIEQVTEMSDLYDSTYFTWVLVSPTREDVHYNGIGVPCRSRWRIIDRIVAAGGITSTRILTRSITCSFISSVSTTCISAGAGEWCATNGVCLRVYKRLSLLIINFFVEEKSVL